MPHEFCVSCGHELDYTIEEVRIKEYQYFKRRYYCVVCNKKYL